MKSQVGSKVATHSLREQTGVLVARSLSPLHERERMLRFSYLSEEKDARETERLVTKPGTRRSCSPTTLASLLNSKPSMRQTQITLK
jgi:hypothetical protein